MKRSCSRDHNSFLGWGHVKGLTSGTRRLCGLGERKTLCGGWREKSFCIKKVPVSTCGLDMQFSDVKVKQDCFFVTMYTDKKENKSFLIYKEIQTGSGANSYEEGLPNI
jgi:hypothetical protein